MSRRRKKREEEKKRGINCMVNVYKFLPPLPMPIIAHLKFSCLA